MIEKNAVTEVVNEFIAGKELFLVSVSVTKNNIIEVVVDSMAGVPLDMCVALSRFIESKFDRDTEDYELTVASASISDPFVLVEQYRKNLGREVEVMTISEGKSVKRKGVLAEVGDGAFVLEYNESVEAEGKKKKEKCVRRESILYADAKTRLIIKI